MGSLSNGGNQERALHEGLVLGLVHLGDERKDGIEAPRSTGDTIGVGVQIEQKVGSGSGHRGVEVDIQGHLGKILRPEGLNSSLENCTQGNMDRQYRLLVGHLRWLL
ncbi:hypothetical protein O6H91_Y397000 [Diphasiastrum complanatum]|nr:hypothetical protein O6H91_Y397000 [Diphasiastrum complanatum]